MDSVNLAPFLALPLVGGYGFAIIWKGSLYFSARESGHRLYLRSVFYAVIMIVWAALIHVILFVNFPLYQTFIAFICEVLYSNNTRAEPTMWSSSSILTILSLSFVIGPLVGGILNIPHFHGVITNMNIPYTKYRPFYWWVMLLLEQAIKNNDFEKLIMRGIERNIPILFSLNSGKVYVGWAVRAPNPTQERRAIRILPLLSGYRSPETQILFFTTDYLAILNSVTDGDKEFDHLEIGDFEVILPTSQICNCHLFDTSAFTYFADTKIAAEDVAESVGSG